MSRPSKCRRTTLHRSERTWLFRQELPNGAGSMICKQPLGPDAPYRLQHELGILSRLAGIEGVPTLVREAPPDEVIAMKDEGGVLLTQRLRSGRLDQSMLPGLALRLARLLAAVHSRGVLHGNLNPSHILIEEDGGTPLLIDFHLATSNNGERPEFADHSQIRGTLAYLAPERTGRTGREVDQRSDLYALGATFYELATGRPPFAADDPLQLIHYVLVQAPTPPIELNPLLPLPFSAILMRLLEKEPDRRYQSADGLVHDLSLLQDALRQGKEDAFELGQRDFALRLIPPSHLVGRETEISALQRAFEDAQHQQKRGVLVTGVPGVGKTALINTLRPLVTARRGWFVSGKFDQLRQDLDTDAVYQAFRAIGRLLLAEPEAELAEHRARLLQTLGSNAGLIAARLPEFALLLAVPPMAPVGDLLNAERQLIQAGLDLLRAIVSPARPLVMVIDDLQWAAALPTRLFNAILMDEGLRGLLLVGAYRDAEVDVTHPLSALLSRWDQLDPPPLRLPLQNLPPADLETFLGEMLRLPPSEAARLGEAVGAQSAGNPFDTVELINALRSDGALVPNPDGWSWDAATIRRFVGHGNVTDLLAARVRKLPDTTQAMLNIMVCLGGELPLDWLQAASGLTTTELETQLAPAIDDGLLVMDEDNAVRFRHDRVQQAVYSELDGEQLCSLHLALARRLAALPGSGSAAAAQYLPVINALREPEERRLAVGLFRDAATSARLTNPAASERFLVAAIKLLTLAETPEDAPLLAALEIDRHAVLYSLGRLEEADELYGSIERRCRDSLEQVDAACVQICSLTHRARPGEAVTLGLDLLKRLGLTMPENLGAEINSGLDALSSWILKMDRTEEIRRPEVQESRVVGMMKVLNKIVAPSLLSDPAINAWLSLKSQRLWVEYGPCPWLMSSLGALPMLLIAMRQDYRTGYAGAQHVLAVGEARGYESAMHCARCLIVSSVTHWFEPLEDCIVDTQLAREGLLREGDVQFASYSYYSSMAALLDCAPTLDGLAPVVESSLVFSARTGNHHTTRTYLPYRQLVRGLRGETRAPDTFTDDSFDEEEHAAGIRDNPMALGSFHIHRALLAAVFGDVDAMVRHSAGAMQVLPTFPGFYQTLQAYFLRSLALAAQARVTSPESRVALLAEFDACRDWLAQRAADAPQNFLHLFKFAEAERAWAVNDFSGAMSAFDAALREAELRQRPWHQALIAEHAGLFHLALGLEHAGRKLLTEARRLYGAWGARAKVAVLERDHPFVRVSEGSRGRQGDPSDAVTVTSDAIDMLAILEASQALSSETNLARLKERVVELLCAMTGATTVRLVLWHDSHAAWFLSATADDVPLSVEEAGARGLLPLSAFRYVERTREPLLVDDATRDDRFSRDPCVAGLKSCSLLVMPILSKGHPIAVLMLENRLSSSAFSANRLDAVKLVAGQLAVSLENALLYEELEQRVQQRTRELRKTQSELLEASRRAGMAEVATSVLHNVGNVLNSVNISASMVGETIKASKVSNLAKAVALLREHEQDLGTFLTSDPKGKQLPDYLTKLSEYLLASEKAASQELESLRQNIEHIKEIVSMQQSYARVSGVKEIVDIRDLAEDSLRMNVDGLGRHHVEIIREFEDVPLINIERHKVLQILVNLIRNAKHACQDSDRLDKRLTVRVASEAGRIKIAVSDNGVGIPPENLTRIFNHGFTTRKNGHGFGLHSGALAAKELGGRLDVHSAGSGHGATFTLELPCESVSP